MSDITVTEVRGVSMRLLTSNRSLQLCARMNYETENLDFIDSMGSEDTLFDLGSCEGRFAIYSALKGISTVAIEPEAHNHGALLENRALNGVEAQLQVFHRGVGAQDDTATLKIGQPWAGGHQKVVDVGETRADLDFDFQTTQTIEVVRLDSLIANESLPSPTHLKVDIDGSELPFLAGAQRTLADPSLKAILFELNVTDPSYAFICTQLAERAFQIKSSYPIPNEPNLRNVWFERA